ncbi:MAG TPA: SDR family oxidoreductase [Clostridiaceae bacterium]|nr:SDR family oxidoreductase [Clostridiaceae bacterium]
MRTCIITGASDGIGKATAIEIARSREYDNLILIARNSEKLKSVNNIIKDIINSKPIIYDLTNLDGIPNLIKKIYCEYKSINCLINVAGYADPQPLIQTSIGNLNRTYTINVFAPVILIRECVKYMRYNKEVSKILNVASTAGITPRPGWLSYASSKAAIIAVSQTLSEELAEYNIKVYTVSPGRCATVLRRKLAPNEDQSKIMQPEEVAKVISNLLSKDEKCLDGQNIIVRRKW